MKRLLGTILVSTLFVGVLIVLTTLVLQIQKKDDNPTILSTPSIEQEYPTNASGSSHAALNDLYTQSEMQQTARTYGRLTQIPFIDAGNATVTSEDQEVEARSTVYTTPNGELSSIDLRELKSKTTYIVDLSAFSCLEIAVAWPKGDLFYSFSNDENPELFAMKPSDDIQPFESGLTSPLIECPTTAPRILTLAPQSEMSSVRIDLFLTESLSAQSPQLENIFTSGMNNLDSGASFSTLPIISRDVWGANTYAWDPYSNTDIDDPSRFVWEPAYHRTSKIVIHHTETTSNPSNPIAAIRSMYLYHTYTRGWGDIGYNYLVDQYGNIYEGKAGGDGVAGYHAFAEANAMSIGIAMIGSFTYTAPTAAAQSSLAKLMAEKAAFYGFELRRSNGSLEQWLDTSYTVYGHVDSWFWCYPEHAYFNNLYICASRVGWARNSTGCPGNKLAQALSSTIISEAQQYKSENFQELSSLAEEVHNNILLPHYSDVLIVGFNLPKDVEPSIVRMHIPKFSGITDVTVTGNTAYIKVLDWDNEGTAVPPTGWDGYNGPGTFFPPSNGTDERIENLIKLFKLDPDVRFAEAAGKRTLFRDTP